MKARVRAALSHRHGMLTGMAKPVAKLVDFWLGHRREEQAASVARQRAVGLLDLEWQLDSWKHRREELAASVSRRELGRGGGERSHKGGPSARTKKNIDKSVDRPQEFRLASE
jgi:hypothetical protein